MNTADRIDTLVRADADRRTCPICGDTSDRCTFERACSCWYGKSCKRRQRCTARHPSHPRQVRCEEARGHSGDHFHSFYMRAWSDDDGRMTGDTWIEHTFSPSAGSARVCAICGAFDADSEHASEYYGRTAGNREG